MGRLAKVEPDDSEMKTTELTNVQLVEIEGAHLLEDGAIIIANSDGNLTIEEQEG